MGEVAENGIGVSPGNISKNVVTIWKGQENNWAVNLPGQDTSEYASIKGFSVLHHLNPGDGFRINCSEAIILDGSFESKGLWISKRSLDIELD